MSDLKKEYLGDNPDGSPHFKYTYTGEGEPHFFLSNADATGAVALSDGTVYDVTAPVIVVATHKHALELSKQVEKQLRAKGRHPEQIAEATA